MFMNDFERWFFNDRFSVIDSFLKPREFFDTYLGLFTGLNRNEVRVFSYILNNFDCETKDFNGTYDQIQRDLDINRVALSNAMTSLQEKKFITKTRNGVWHVEEKISVPEEGKDIIIRFNNNCNSSSIDSVKDNKEVPKLLDTSKFDLIKDFASKVYESMINLHPEFASEINSEDFNSNFNNILEKYNTDERIVIDENSKKVEILSDDILNIVNSGSIDRILNGNLKTNIDPAYSDKLKTLNNYKKFLSEAGFSNESIYMVLEFLNNMFDIKDNLPGGVSIENIKAIINSEYSIPGNFDLYKLERFLTTQNTSPVTKNYFMNVLRSGKLDFFKSFINIKTSDTYYVNYDMLFED